MQDEDASYVVYTALFFSNREITTNETRVRTFIEIQRKRENQVPIF